MLTMSLDRIVRTREMVDKVCASIDAGESHPSEHEMAALAQIVVREAGPLAHDLLVKLASRCRNGRAALNSMAH